jgi:protein MAK11
MVPEIESLNSKAVVENPQNRELGNLLHHSSSVTALNFPTRGKLLSSAEDSTIAITRTRDWSLLSTIKTPIPKPVGRPSGDTAPMGGTPSGVNDFAVHPSMKLMISVGKGEKCMRLWNLVTGKKAGVLNFERVILAEVGEGRFSSGEGRKVAWGSTNAGEEFCVGFDRGVLVFGMDSKPKCKVVPEPRSKIHQLFYTEMDETDTQLLAVSAEDGRVLFYSTRQADLITASSENGKEVPLPSARLVAQLGGKDAGQENWGKFGKQVWRKKWEAKVKGDEGKAVSEVSEASQDEAEKQAELQWVTKFSTRIKDFAMLSVGKGVSKCFFILTASSDGALRIWKLLAKDLAPNTGEAKQVGMLLGTYETPNRITCMQAFVMLPSKDESDDDFGQFNEVEDSAESSSSDSE